MYYLNRVIFHQKSNFWVWKLFKAPFPSSDTKHVFFKFQLLNFSKICIQMSQLINFCVNRESILLFVNCDSIHIFVNRAHYETDPKNC